MNSCRWVSTKTPTQLACKFKGTLLRLTFIFLTSQKGIKSAVLAQLRLFLLATSGWTTAELRTFKFEDLFDSVNSNRFYCCWNEIQLTFCCLSFPRTKFNGKLRRSEHFASAGCKIVLLTLKPLCVQYLISGRHLVLSNGLRII